ncbi:tetratricopeptide repeat protein [Candidatus Uhrbacteria bacterium]|nr:tetratricopeptide repeat protein [Candidatus Uhrbacteria bacterium]
MWWIVPLGIIGVSAAVVAAICLRKVPVLRVMNVEDLPQEKTKQVKEAIILERFQRSLRARFSGTFQVLARVGTGISRLGRRAVQRIYAIEQTYRKMQKEDHLGSHTDDQETIRQFMDEAAEFFRQGDAFQAEKRYIEIISRYPKHVKAYEELGNLYLHDRQYAQARETLAFAVKLNPEDASVQMSLGELAMKEGNPDRALASMRRVVALRPHNPKYLDFLIETALAADSVEDARQGLAMLQEVNPENKKLGEFAARIDAAKPL